MRGSSSRQRVPARAGHGLPTAVLGRDRGREWAGSLLRWRKKRLKVVLAYAVVLLAIAIPALAYAAHAVFFASSPPPFQGAIDAFARVGGPPGHRPNTPAVTTDPRRVLTVPLSNGMTAALWAAPTIDHNYCFATQIVSDDPTTSERKTRVATSSRPAWGSIGALV